MDTSTVARPPVSDVNTALFRSQASLRRGLSRAQRRSPSAAQSFADVGRPTMNERSTAQAERFARAEAVARQARVQKRMLEAAVDKRTRTSLATLEPESPAAVDALRCILAAQAAAAIATQSGTGAASGARRRLALRTEHPLTPADLFVVVQAIRQSLPWTRALEFASLECPMYMSQQVTAQLLSLTQDLRIEELVVSPACHLRDADRQNLQDCCNANRRKREERQARSRIIKLKRELAAISEQPDTQAESASDCDNNDTNPSAVDELVEHESASRTAVMRAFIEAFAALAALCRRERESL
jgi:hypothetical protein